MVCCSPWVATLENVLYKDLLSQCLNKLATSGKPSLEPSPLPLNGCSGSEDGLWNCPHFWCSDDLFSKSRMSNQIIRNCGMHNSDRTALTVETLALVDLATINRLQQQLSAIYHSYIWCLHEGDWSGDLACNPDVTSLRQENGCSFPDHLSNSHFEEVACPSCMTQGPLTNHSTSGAVEMTMVKTVIMGLSRNIWSRENDTAFNLIALCSSGDGWSLLRPSFGVNVYKSGLETLMKQLQNGENGHIYVT